MNNVFYGIPTVEEMRIYLKHKEYSLLNKWGLRCEILSFRGFRNVKPSEERSSEQAKHEDKGIRKVKHEISNGPMNDENIGEGDLREMIEKIERDMAHIDEGKVMEEGRRVNLRALRPKEINTLTRKNTRKNSGYKCIRLEIKTKTVFSMEGETDRGECTIMEDIKRKDKKITFIERNEIPDHNNGTLVPILMKNRRNANTGYIHNGRVEIIPIKNVVYIPPKKEENKFIFKKKNVK
jgi:hypothetical protein